jgi:hypothetical protein
MKNFFLLFFPGKVNASVPTTLLLCIFLLFLTGCSTNHAPFNEQSVEPLLVSTVTLTHPGNLAPVQVYLKSSGFEPASVRVREGQRVEIISQLTSQVHLSRIGEPYVQLAPGELQELSLEDGAYNYVCIDCRYIRDLRIIVD